ncbi:flotillin-1 [Elysia marginata]|uniref:Flotillin-1 n=1 Tax=Elysia marginata TaxID=1093978 RepID=A0AAV4JVX3_9GAST|nr:flotillin-1 [Elysia marginata]
MIFILLQVKVFGDVPELLERAAENFLGKSVEEIGDIVKETLQGHQRSVIVNRKLEDIYFDREETAKLVFETAAPDLGRMGICIDSYTIPDVWDGQGHLKAVIANRAERMNEKDAPNKA